MLECGLLEGMHGLFIDDFEDIDHEELGRKLDQFAKLYTMDLVLTVQTILNVDPKERKDWIGLKQYVPQKNRLKLKLDGET